MLARSGRVRWARWLRSLKADSKLECDELGGLARRLVVAYERRGSLVSVVEVGPVGGRMQVRRPR